MAVGGGIALPVILTAVVITIMLTAARIVIPTLAVAAAGNVLTVMKTHNVLMVNFLVHQNARMIMAGSAKTAIILAISSIPAIGGQGMEIIMAKILAMDNITVITAVQMGTAIHPLNQSLP